jgi:hypothetical protein
MRVLDFLINKVINMRDIIVINGFQTFRGYAFASADALSLIKVSDQSLQGRIGEVDHGIWST